MRTALKVWVVLALWAVGLLAQPGPAPQIQYRTSAPSGACGPTNIALLTTTGVLYTCVAGVWTVATTPGGGATPPAITSLLAGDGAGGFSDSGLAPATVVKGAAALGTATYLPYVTSAGTLTSDANLAWDATNKILKLSGDFFTGTGAGVYFNSEVKIGSALGQRVLMLDTGVSQFGFSTANGAGFVVGATASGYVFTRAQSANVSGGGCGSTLCAADAGVTSPAANVIAFGNGTIGDVSAIAAYKASRYTAVLFANLATAYTTNGDSGYCSDCTVTSGSDDTCAGSGSGADVMRLNGVYRCRI